MSQTIHFYSDPGHGWAKVKRELLYDLEIAQDISSYSYIRGDYVYLEEDCDLSALCRALDKRNIPVKFINHNANKPSKIRSYESYK